MTKMILKLSPLLLLTVLLSGCHDDDDKKDVKNEPEFPTEFSELTVEQSKQNLENNGIELAKSITDLKNSSGIQTTIAFSSFLENNPPENLSSGRSSSNGGIIKLLSSFGKNKSSLSKTLSGLRTAEDEFESFQQEYDASKGVYTYNKGSDTWSYEAGGNNIVFKFPSTKEGTLNNAQYSVYDFTSVTITSDLGGEDYNGDYPTGLKAELTIDGVKKMGYTFSASYNSAGDPSAISIVTTIDDFALSYNVTNTTSKASVDYSLKKAGKDLLLFGTSATGTFSTSAVDDSEGPADVIESGTAYFQILNIKFSGLINAKALSDALDATDTDEGAVAAWNANYKLLVYYVDSRKKIADSEFYLNETDDDTSLEIRMIFADGSKSDLKTYTDVGFEDLKTEIDSLIGEDK